MTVLDMVQIGFLIIVVVAGLGGTLYVVINEDKEEK